MSRWICANLDAELHWARMSGCSPRALSAAALRHASTLGVLTRVLWPDAEQVWTPGPVDPRCLREVPGLPSIALTTGELPKDPPIGLWADARSSSAMRANARQFAFDVGTAHGVVLAGSAWVGSIAELGDLASSAPRWVLKAPFGTAGRGFIHGAESDDVTTGKLGRRIARALSAYGQLLFEPWVERAFDVGHVTHTDSATVRSHRILSDAQGRFGGIVCQRAAHKLDTDTRAVVERVRTALRAVSYQGPFGIDGFVARDGLLVPLCEINARHTFGHVAHALLERVAPATWEACGLRFGHEPQRRTPETIALLGSPDGTHMTAWIEHATP